MTQAIRACVIFFAPVPGEMEIQKDKSLKRNRSFLYPAHCLRAMKDIKKLLFLLRLLSFCISLTRLHVDSLDYRVVAGVVKHLDGIRHYPQV